MHRNSIRRTIIFPALALVCSFFAPMAALASEQAGQTGSGEVPTLLSSSIQGASVAVDGIDRGTTPVEVPLRPGRHFACLRPSGAPATYVEFETGTERAEVTFEVPAPTCAVLVSAEPAGASVTLDGASVGSSPLLLPQVAEGDHELLIEAPGCKPQRIPLKLRAPEPALLRVALASTSAALSITSEPSGAEVSVNGVPRGRAPIVVPGVPEGTAVVEASLDGYEPWRFELQVRSGDSAPVTAVLRRKPATLSVTSIPTGARIYVDDAFRGVAPVSVPDLPPGAHRVRAELPGHDPMARTVPLEPGAVAAEEFRLRANTGTLRVSTAPAGVSVQIDGKEFGVTSAPDGESDSVSSELVIAAVPTGRRRVSFVRRGWMTVEREADVERDGTLSLGLVKLERDLTPDMAVTTKNGSVVRGVFLEKAGGFYRLETQRGVIRAIPFKDIERVQLLRSDGNHLDAETP